MSRADADSVADSGIEAWCNAVASELLIPGEQFTKLTAGLDWTPETLDELASQYRVSTVVVIRRLLDLGRIDHRVYQALVESEATRLAAVRRDARDRDSGGGNYYYTQPIRLSRTLTRALVEDTLEGGTLYTEAFRLIGSRKPKTFETLAERVEAGKV